MNDQAPPLLTSGPGRQPLYASLAGLISEDIRSGKYPPGSHLPSEQELAKRYGISRQTVRQALRIVRDDGQISSHPGIGTVVRVKKATHLRYSSVNSIDDLLQFVGDTEMHLVALREITVDSLLAQQLECNEGVLISEASFLRKSPIDNLPVGYVFTYVHPRFAQAQKEGVASMPIYKNIERLFGVKIHEVRQDISARVLDKQLADVLLTKEGDAALQIKRFFYDANGTPIATSIGYYPADRYTQSARFRPVGDSI